MKQIEEMKQKRSKYNSRFSQERSISNKFANFNTKNPKALKSLITRKSSKIVELGTKKFEEIKEEIEHNQFSDIYSEEEEEDDVISFSQGLHIVRNNAHKYDIFDIVPLDKIEKYHEENIQHA